MNVPRKKYSSCRYSSPCLRILVLATTCFVLVSVFIEISYLAFRSSCQPLHHKEPDNNPPRFVKRDLALREESYQELETNTTAPWSPQGLRLETNTTAPWFLPLSSFQLATAVPKRQWMQPSEEGNSMGETHAPNCRYHVLNTGTIYKGDIVKIRIETRDKYNQPRVVGGDFWYARLESSKMPVASTTGTVIDYNNGTYMILFLAAWAGPANINIILEHPSDAAEFIKGVWWHTDPKVYWQAIYQSPQNPSLTRTVACTIQSPGIWKNKCIYPHPSAIGRTSFTCDKPQGLPCSAIVQTRAHDERLQARVMQVLGDKRFLFEGTNYHQEINGDVSTLKFKESTVSFNTELPKCQPDAPTMTFKGYWMDSQWHPLDCLKYNCWNKPSLVGECFRNKEVHIMGDSNGRQYFETLIQLLPPEPPASRKLLMVHHEHQYQYYTKYNITMTYEFHPEAIMGQWINFHDNYIVDFLDHLRNPSCDYVIILTVWAHFSQWRPDALEERLLLLREAVDRLLRRCPDVPVIVKSPHPRDHKIFRSIVLSSDIMLNEIRKMLRNMFANSGVFYLDVWDMNVAFPGANNLHMPYDVIKEELFMILSYVCDSVCKQ